MKVNERFAGRVSTEPFGARNADLLRAVHDQHASALWSYVVNLTHGDRGTAQDVVQETLLRAWRNPAVLEQSHASARPWLFTVAKHIVIDEWRSARRRPRLLTNDYSQYRQQTITDTAQQTVDRQLVLAALQTLSTEHRRVLLECYYRGASVAEAAETLGVPPGTVKSRTHYALRALRQVPAVSANGIPASDGPPALSDTPGDGHP
jgi:RNA polymerase sigma-70 factor (ECF subfamily)